MMMNTPLVKVFKIILKLIVGNLIIVEAATAGIYDEPPRGFVWYNEEIPLKTKEVPTKNSATKISTAQNAKMRNQQLSQKLDDAIQVVLDNPTVENAMVAQQAQKQVMDRSEAVANSWVLAALLDPSLLKFKDNQNVLHRELQKDINKEEIINNLKQAANDWGILFYWMQGCIYCQRFITIITVAQQSYGFKVLAVSDVGGNFGPFEGRKDTGLIRKLNPYGEAPLLFLVHKDGKEIYPIARGITDLDQIGENILMIIKYSKERGSNEKN